MKTTSHSNTRSNTRSNTVSVKKFCMFCKEGKIPLYTDSVTLKRYLSDRAKIIPKQRSGVCAKHQRALAREIKRARELALLPFSLHI